MSSGATSIQSQFNLNSDNPNGEKVYEFESFRLDGSHLMLYCDGEAIALAPKVVETLLALVERRGDIVSKNEMMERLWKNAFVEDSNLTQNIYLLRKTLGKGSDGRDLIETFRRRGYRFTGQIKESGILPLTAEESPEPPLSGTAPGFFSMRKLLFLVAVAGLLFSGFGVYRFINRQPENPNEKLRALQMSVFSNNEKVVKAAISPDGKLVAYAAFGGEGQSLWIRPVAAPSDIKIVEPDYGLYGSLTFSPDNNYIYYSKAKRSQSQLSLYKIPAFGGASIKILEEIEGSVSFSPDGKRFVFVRKDTGKGESFLMTANPDGSEEKILVSKTWPQFFVPNPAWSPDGKKIVCAGMNLVDARGPVGLLEISAEDGSIKELGDKRFGRNVQPQWLADGSGLILAGSDISTNFTAQLWHVAYPGGEASRITNDLSDYGQGGVSLSGDSSILVAAPRSYNSKIWISSAKEPSTATQATAGKQDGMWGISWAPDGGLIHTSGEYQVWSMAENGTNAKILTPEENNKRYSSVSPDGRYVVFQSWRENQVGLWRIDTDGSNLIRLTTGIDTVPRVSPDGNWVVFASAKSGRYTLWRTSIDGGEATQLTDKYALAPAISPDGKEIACFYWDEQPKSPLKIAILPFEGGEFTRVFEEPQFTRFIYPFMLRNSIQWAPDGKSLTFIQTINETDNLWSLHPESGQLKQATDFKTDRIYAFDWSQDGEKLAFARGTMTGSVVLITDFR